MEAQSPRRLLATALFFSLAIPWGEAARAESGPRGSSNQRQVAIYFSHRGAYEDAIYGARRRYRAVERLANSRSNPFRLGFAPRTPIDRSRR
ncbi:MAG TPA: hypothetical protein VF278_17350 [Pirellulales bacterium]